MKDLLGNTVGIGDEVAFAVDKEKLRIAEIVDINDEEDWAILDVKEEHGNYLSRIYIPSVSICKLQTKQ